MCTSLEVLIMSLKGSVSNNHVMMIDLPKKFGLFVWCRLTLVTGHGVFFVPVETKHVIIS